MFILVGEGQSCSKEEVRNCKEIRPKDVIDTSGGDASDHSVRDDPKDYFDEQDSVWPSSSLTCKKNYKDIFDKVHGTYDIDAE